MKTRIPPPVIALFCAGLIAIAAYLSTPVLPAPYTLIIATVLMLLGLAIAIVAVAQFRQMSTTINPLHPERASELVANGLFRYSRNPMYLGMLLVLIGLAFYGGRWQGLLGPIVFVVLINRWQIEPEERALEQLFGERFADYCRRVPRWFATF